ncbi:MAG: response regulator transcription factor [Oligoflexia bacterium]|nr:response regulator transcription factor [Oligoflexia bacterium]
MSTSVACSNALLLEDERDLAIALQIALRKIGIDAKQASTIAQAREMIKNSSAPFEFLLLDRNLPDGDGLDLCAEMRAQGFSGRILMLTAIGDTSDRVLGLNQGADDYLAKPFSWEELDARIRALVRRSPAPAAPASTSNSAPNGWNLDEARLRIQGPRGTWVTLTPLEYKLAACLIESSGTIVSRERLLKEVWGFTLLPRTRTVDHFLGRLRKHFEENAETPKHFITVRGAGYRFEP